MIRIYYRVFVLALFIIIAFTSTAQFATVPKKMKLGTMELHITESARKNIQKDVDRLTRSMAFYHKLADRMALYGPIIDRELALRNVPYEVRYLALQESGLVSDAVSSANAVGFWQFKDFTAIEVGLQVDERIDERKNIASASMGAAKYLKSHYLVFKNWVYAIMAYNTGRGGAKPYLNESLYGAKKMTINMKTHWYVRTFLAHVVAFSPSRSRPHSENLTMFELASATNTSLKKIAKEANIDAEKLKEYNKWTKSGHVPNQKTYTVLYPSAADKNMVAFTREKNNTESIAKERTTKTSKNRKEQIDVEAIIERVLSNTRSYATRVDFNGIPAVIARKNETIKTLSMSTGISIEKLYSYNDIDSKTAIESGKIYFLKKKKNKSKVKFHVVQKGEKLIDVAQLYGIKLASLKNKNRIQPNQSVKNGRVLWLNKKRPKDISVAYYEIPPHKVVKNPKDVLLVVAPPKKTRVPATPKQHTLVPTEKIEKVFTASSDPTPMVLTKPLRSAAKPVVKKMESIATYTTKKSTSSTHKVKTGETLYSIAKKYRVNINELIALNKLDKTSKIHVGQVLQIKSYKVVNINDKRKKLNTYVVQKGETVYSVAKKHNMTIAELLKTNKKNSKVLSIGESLKVYN